jgi:negative regulator of sigma E activity
MSERDYQQLIEAARVRALTPPEESRLRAWLLTHPESQSEWDAEQQVSRALRQLPDVPPAPDFTNRVLASLESEDSHQPQAPPLSLLAWWRRWSFAPRFAVLALSLVLAGLSLWQARVRERQRVAESMQVMAVAVTVPEIDLLRDFEAIHRLSQLPPLGDDDLIRASP